MILRPECPICKKSLPESPEEAQAHFPFCSERCRKVDLFRWWDGKYAVVEDLDPEVATLMQLEGEIPVAPSDDSAENNRS
ncbi:MAG: DNA gyrase inhibitor YacG [Planctomycetaceae bacterium]|nr:DNA gyrase inhibitor YacG [Planctomycetaceae bacterium]